MRFAPGWAIMCTNIRALLTVGWHAVFVPKTNLAPDARQEDVRNMVGVSIITVAVKKGFPDVGNAVGYLPAYGIVILESDIRGYMLFYIFHYLLKFVE